MITESVTKSSITAVTTFRKDLTLQGCTMFTTRTNRLLMPHDWRSSGERWQRVVSHNLYLASTYSMSHPKGLSPPSGDGHSPTWNHLLHGRVGLPESSSSSNPGCSWMMHLLLLLVSKRFAKWNTRTMWLMGRSKQVSQSTGLSSMGPRMVVRSVLDQGTRTQFLGCG